MEQGVLFSAPKMARYLGVTQTWLKGEAASGRVPALKAGNRYLFNPAAVENALAKRAAESVGGAV